MPSVSFLRKQAVAQRARHLCAEYRTRSSGKRALGDIVGTIAGDDTIFVAAKDSPAQRRPVRELKKLTAARVG